MNPDNDFDAVVRHHYEALFRFALSLTRAESDACDLTQQTFYVWATKGQQLQDRSKVKSWLFTTLHRLFLQTRRRQTRFPHHYLEDVLDELPTDLPRFDDRADSPTVLAALARIDENYRAAVALFYLEDCSYKEIAAILEIPIGTVKSRIARGIGQLRSLLLPTTVHETSARTERKSYPSTSGRPGGPSGVDQADVLAPKPRSTGTDPRSERGYRDTWTILFREQIVGW